MNRKLLFLTIILFSLGIKAQVGVKTENPQGVFHIDGQGNTSGNTNISDDIVVTATGNVGVGTNAPATKVDIRTSTSGNGFRLRDGSQADGRVLTSDVNGNARWRAHGIQTINAVWNKDVNFSLPSNTSTFISTGSTITLPPGRWMIMTYFIATRGLTLEMTSSYWIRGTYLDGTITAGTSIIGTSAPSVDFEGNNKYVSGLAFGPHSMITGAVVINNANSINKTYTFAVGVIVPSTGAPLVNFVRTAQGAWLEDNITAIKLQD